MPKKYEQIVEYIMGEIENKILKPGAKVPSIRDLSITFGCSKSSVIRAFDELENMKIIYSKPKSGYYIIEGDKADIRHGISERYDYLSGNIDRDILPHREFTTCISKALDLYGEGMFGFTNTQGFEPLVSTVKDFLTDYQVFARESNIFITSGSQQALFLLSNMPFPNGKNTVLVEQPTYLFMLDILKLHGINTVGIELKNGVLDMDRLESIFRTGNIKFFYTMPRFHHPASVSYSREQKKSVAALADKYDVYIVEDDHLADLDINSRVDPLFSYDTSSHVIYLRSFTKAAIPGVRLAAVVVPELLIQAFRKSKFLNDVFAPPLLQASMELFIKSGMYSNHIRHVKQFYSERMLYFKTTWDSLDVKNIKAHIPETGFFSWFELPNGINVEYVKHVLQQINIYIDTGLRYYLPEFYKNNTIKLCINNIGNEKIQKSLPIIADEIKRAFDIAGPHGLYS